METTLPYLPVPSSFIPRDNLIRIDESDRPASAQVRKAADSACPWFMERYKHVPPKSIEGRILRKGVEVCASKLRDPEVLKRQEAFFRIKEEIEKWGVRSGETYYDGDYIFVIREVQEGRILSVDSYQHKKDGYKPPVVEAIKASFVQSVTSNANGDSRRPVSPPRPVTPPVVTPQEELPAAEDGFSRPITPLVPPSRLLSRDPMPVVAEEPAVFGVPRGLSSLVRPRGVAPLSVRVAYPKALISRAVVVGRDSGNVGASNVSFPQRVRVRLQGQWLGFEFERSRIIVDIRTLASRFFACSSDEVFGSLSLESSRVSTALLEDLDEHLVTEENIVARHSSPVPPLTLPSRVTTPVVAEEPPRPVTPPVVTPQEELPAAEDGFSRPITPPVPPLRLTSRDPMPVVAEEPPPLSRRASSHSSESWVSRHPLQARFFTPIESDADDDLDSVETGSLLTISEWGRWEEERCEDLSKPVDYFKVLCQHLLFINFEDDSTATKIGKAVLWFFVCATVGLLALGLYAVAPIAYDHFWKESHEARPVSICYYEHEV